MRSGMPQYELPNSVGGGAGANGNLQCHAFTSVLPSNESRTVTEPPIRGLANKASAYFHHIFGLGAAPSYFNRGLMESFCEERNQGAAAARRCTTFIRREGFSHRDMYFWRRLLAPIFLVMVRHSSIAGAWWALRCTALPNNCERPAKHRRSRHRALSAAFRNVPTSNGGPPQTHVLNIRDSSRDAFSGQARTGTRCCDRSADACVASAESIFGRVYDAASRGRDGAR